MFGFIIAILILLLLPAGAAAQPFRMGIVEDQVVIGDLAVVRLLRSGDEILVTGTMAPKSEFEIAILEVRPKKGKGTSWKSKTDQELEIDGRLPASPEMRVRITCSRIDGRVQTGRIRATVAVPMAADGTEAEVRCRRTALEEIRCDVVEQTAAATGLSDEDCLEDRRLFGLPAGPCELTAKELARVAARPVRAMTRDS